MSLKNILAVQYDSSVKSVIVHMDHVDATCYLKIMSLQDFLQEQESGAKFTCPCQNDTPFEMWHQYV